MLPRLRFLFCVVFATLCVLLSLVSKGQSIEWHKRSEAPAYLTSFIGNASGDLLITSDDRITVSDSNGDTIWSELLQGVLAADFDEFGNVYVTGNLKDSIDFDPGSSNFILSNTKSIEDNYIAKYNSNGAFIWAKQIEAVSDSSNEVEAVPSAEGIVASNGTITLVYNIYGNGKIDFDPGIDSMFINDLVDEDFAVVMQLDVNGDFSDIARIGGLGPMVNGSFPSGASVTIRKMVQDDNGNLLILGDHAAGDSLYIVRNGTYTRFGMSNSTANGLILKLGSSLGVQWVDFFYDNLNFGIGDCVVDNNGNVLVTGEFRHTVDFDPGINTAFRTTTLSFQGNHSYADAFVLKLSSTGHFVWCKTFGGKAMDWGTAITVDNQNNVFIGGMITNGYGLIDFDPSSPVYYTGPHPEEYPRSAFLQKFSPSGVHKWARVFRSGFNYPIRGLWKSPSNKIYGIANLGGEVDLDFGPGIDISFGSGPGLLFKFMDDCTDLVDSVSESSMCSFNSASGYYIWDSSGTYIDQLISVNGCDSFLTINLTIHDSTYYGEDTLQIVSGDSINLGGGWQTQSGVYIDTLSSQTGCDSIVETVLNVESTNAIQCSGSTSYNEWAYTIAGVESENTIEVEVDQCGNSYSLMSTNSNSLYIDIDSTVLNVGTSTKVHLLVKHDAQGKFVWQKRLSFSASSIAVNANGKIAITGSFSGTKDFDPGNGSYMMTATELSDIAICLLDQNGDFEWAKQIRSWRNPSYNYAGLRDSGGDIVFGNNDEILVTGRFNYDSDTVDFNPNDTIDLFSVFISCNGPCSYNNRFILSLEPNGDYRWHKKYLVNNTSEGRGGRLKNAGSLAIDPTTGNVINAFMGTPFQSNAWSFHTTYQIHSIDVQTGFTDWTYETEGPDTGLPVYFKDVELDHEGNVYALFRFMWTVSPGSLENTEEYDAQYYVSGYGYSSGINEVEATMLVKLNGDGDYQWASPQMKQLGYGGWTEPWSSMGTQIEVFGNSIVIAGQSIRDFYMKDNSNSLLATISDDTNFYQPTWDTYVAMYDLDGEPIDYKIIGGTGHQHSPIIHKDQNGFIRLLGEYSQNVVLPIDSLNSPLTQTLGYSQYSNQSASLTDMFFYNLYIDSSDAYIQNADTFYMCFGDSVTHQGAVYYDTGSYAIDTTVSNTLYQVINSIRIEFDTALNIIGDTLYLTSGDSAFIAGNWYSQEGTYCDSTNNCDSVVCTTLMFSSSTIAECSGNTSYDEWAFVIGGVEDESVIDAALDDCGNFYVIGFTEGSTSINFNPNGSNNVSFAGGSAKRYFIVKYDATGQLAWAKNLPYQPSSIDVTPNGKIGLIGNFQGTKDFDLGSGINQLTANSGDEIFIATYDADAQLIWVKQLDGDGTDNAGDIAFGPNEEIGFTLGINEFTGSDSIDFNPDTALVDAYGYYSCGGCGNNPMKKFLVVFDSAGQWQWRHMQDATTGCGEVSSPGMCAIDEGGNVFFANVGCGEYWAQGDVHSIYKFNASGNKIWSKHLTGPGANNGDETLGLEVDENGDLYILGKFMNTVLFDSINQISLANDFQGGSPVCYREECGYRAFVAKYDSNGEFKWANRLGEHYKQPLPVENSLGSDLTVKGGTVTYSGHMWRQFDFDPDPNDTAVIFNYDTSMINLDGLYHEAYVVSLSYDGDYKSHFLVGGPEDEGGLQIDLDDLGNVYIAGEFNDQVDLDVDSATLDLESSIGAYDLAFLKVFVDTAVFPENLDSNYVQGPDTCWNTGQKIVNNDREAGDFFGSTVAMDGEWAFTGTTDDLNGSNQNAGAVYAFRKDTNWTQTQKIVPNYRSEGEYFGHLMAVDDDVLMICNDPGSGDTIKVYYFKRNTSNVWEQQQIITAGLTNKTPTSIDIENGYAYVGVSSQGKVLVYELSGSTWSLDQTITGASGNRFGVSVSVEDDLLAVGAIWDDFDENGQNNINKAGSVKLYTRSGQNPWSLSTKVVSPNREANGYFGWDVELMNGELYVGSYTTDYQSLNQAGAVYRLADDSGWSTVQTILPAEHFSGGIFGYAIDSDDDNLIVGHRRYSGVVSGNTLTWEGAAHLFALNDSNEMEEIETFFSTNRNGGDEFGLDVAISGASTIVGSYFDQTDENNSNNVSQAGAAHIFDGDCDPILVVYVYDTTNVELCSGDSTYAQGAWQFNAGQFIDTISIDTILFTNVSIANAINTSDTLTICNGGSVMVHGQMVSQPGTYVDSNQTNAGCDSISTILVQEGTGSYQFELAWIYDGDSTFLGGAYQTTPDLYVDTMASQSGCDSIVETLLWVYPVQYGTDSITICQGESILLGGVMRSSAGTYTDTAMIGGTAHINQVSLFINQPVVSNSTMSITTGDSIYLSGAWRYSSGTYCDTIGGCDTVSCVQLIVGNLTYITIYDSAEICFGDSHWVGTYYAYVSGVYVDTVGNGNGQDTIYHTDLYVDPFNAVVEIYSTGMWLKSNQLNPPFIWFDCDSQTVIATTQQGFYQPGYSGNFSLINQASICGDTSACVYHNNTQNKGNLEVRGYPTSARDQYTLVFETMQSDVQIDLYNLQGQLLHSWMELSIQQTTLPLSNVASGVYLVRIYTTEGQATLKFAKLVD